MPARLIVDGNHVMGTRPDGWWRDRADQGTDLVLGRGCALRGGRSHPVCDGLAPAGEAGLAELLGVWHARGLPGGAPVYHRGPWAS